MMMRALRIFTSCFDLCCPSHVAGSSAPGVRSRAVRWVAADLIGFIMSAGGRSAGDARGAWLNFNVVADRLVRQAGDRILGGAIIFFRTWFQAFLRLARDLAPDGGVTNSFRYGEDRLHVGESTETGETENDDESFAHFMFPDGLSVVRWSVLRLAERGAASPIIEEAATAAGLVRVSVFSLLDIRPGLRGGQSFGLADCGCFGGNAMVVRIIDVLGIGNTHSMTGVINGAIGIGAVGKFGATAVVIYFSRRRLHTRDCTEAGEAESDDENFAHFMFPYGLSVVRWSVLRLAERSAASPMIEEVATAAGLVRVCLFALLDIRAGFRGGQGAGLAGCGRFGRFICNASIVNDAVVLVPNTNLAVAGGCASIICTRARSDQSAIHVERHRLLHACDCTEAGETESDDESFSHFNIPKFVFMNPVRGINSQARRSSVVSLRCAPAYRSARNINARTWTAPK
jgi:hypothetical protein